MIKCFIFRALICTNLQKSYDNVHLGLERHFLKLSNGLNFASKLNILPTFFSSDSLQ